MAVCSAGARGGRILKARHSTRARLLRRSTQRRLPVTIPLHPTCRAVAESSEVFIQGQTRDGKTFRPSDWAERLAGAMSCFRPEGSVGGTGRLHRLLAVLRAAHRRRRQGRRRQPEAARARADGVGLRHELRARQRSGRRRAPGSGRSVSRSRAAARCRSTKKRPATRALLLAEGGLRRRSPAPSPWRPGGSCGAPPCSCGTGSCRRPSR